MPLINVRLIENVFTAEQKQQIARDLTEATVAIEGERMRGVTWCVIEEARAATGPSAVSRCRQTERLHVADLEGRPSMHTNPDIVVVGAASRALQSPPSWPARHQGAAARTPARLPRPGAW